MNTNGTDDMPRDGIPPTDLAPNDLPPVDPVNLQAPEPGTEPARSARVGDRAVMFRIVGNDVDEYAAIVTQFLGGESFRLTVFPPNEGPQFFTARQCDDDVAAYDAADADADAITFAVLS